MRQRVVSVDLSRCGCLFLRATFRWCLCFCSCCSKISEEELLSEVEVEEELEENVSLSEDEKRIGWSLVGLTLLDAPGCVACVEDLCVVDLALCFLCFL